MQLNDAQDLYKLIYLCTLCTLLHNCAYGRQNQIIPRLSWPSAHYIP